MTSSTDRVYVHKETVAALLWSVGLAAGGIALYELDWEILALLLMVGAWVVAVDWYRWYSNTQRGRVQ